ncbi:hypothetical protein Cfor_12576, partial [Coptotermes formosanus]
EQNKIEPAFRTKGEEDCHRRFFLKQQYTPPHIAICTLTTLQTLTWKVLDHPAYRADLVPSDSHLFGSINEALRCQRFADDDEVTETVHDKLRTKPQIFKDLAERWRNFVQKQG